jgi:U3 small nucleolar RNA-associated protein 14
VTGQLMTHPDIAAFKIGEENYLNVKGFGKLVRNRSHCFDSIEIAKKIEFATKNYSMEVVEKSDKMSDGQGNSMEAKARKVVKIPEILKKEFTVNSPFFIGGETKKTTVEIIVSDDTIAFAFDSWEFMKAFREEKERLIRDVVSQLSEKFTCIEVFN